MPRSAVPAVVLTFWAPWLRRTGAITAGVGMELARSALGLRSCPRVSPDPGADMARDVDARGTRRHGAAPGSVVRLVERSGCRAAGIGAYAALSVGRPGADRHRPARFSRLHRSGAAGGERARLCLGPVGASAAGCAFVGDHDQLAAARRSVRLLERAGNRGRGGDRARPRPGDSSRRPARLLRRCRGPGADARADVRASPTAGAAGCRSASGSWPSGSCIPTGRGWPARSRRRCRPLPSFWGSRPPPQCSPIAAGVPGRISRSRGSVSCSCWWRVR